MDRDTFLAALLILREKTLGDDALFERAAANLLREHNRQAHEATAREQEELCRRAGVRQLDQLGNSPTGAN